MLVSSVKRRNSQDCPWVFVTKHFINCVPFREQNTLKMQYWVLRTLPELYLFAFWELGEQPRGFDLAQHTQTRRKKAIPPYGAEFGSPWRELDLPAVKPWIKTDLCSHELGKNISDSKLFSLSGPPWFLSKNHGSDGEKSQNIAIFSSTPPHFRLRLAMNERPLIRLDFPGQEIDHEVSIAVQRSSTLQRNEQD